MSVKVPLGVNPTSWLRLSTAAQAVALAGQETAMRGTLEMPGWSIPWMAAPELEVGSYVTSLPRLSTATHWLAIGHETPVSATPVPLLSICVADGVTVPAVGSNEISLPCPSTAVHVAAAGQATALSACDPSIDALAGAGAGAGGEGDLVAGAIHRACTSRRERTRRRSAAPTRRCCCRVALVSGSLFGLNETSLPLFVYRRAGSFPRCTTRR